MKIKSGQEKELVACDVCGKEVDSAHISWEEDSHLRMCGQCRAEEENCGCSDNYED